MKSLVAALMALTAVFAFTSTTAASAASKDDEMPQHMKESALAHMQRVEHCKPPKNQEPIQDDFLAVVRALLTLSDDVRPNQKTRCLSLLETYGRNSFEVHAQK